MGAYSFERVRGKKEREKKRERGRRRLDSILSSEKILVELPLCVEG